MAKHKCHKCGADLTLAFSVSRLYVSKEPEKYEDSYCLGHYDAEDHFKPDSKPSYPVVHHDLLDNSDECNKCGAVVG
jgi:ribosomal protein S27AE